MRFRRAAKVIPGDASRKQVLEKSEPRTQYHSFRGWFIVEAGSRQHGFSGSCGLEPMKERLISCL